MHDIRAASLTDIDSLISIENACFQSDKLERRNFRYFLKQSKDDLLVLEHDGEVSAYILVLHRRATLLSRIYSLAVLPEKQGLGFASALLAACEAKCLERGRYFLRLEVSEKNAQAIALYKKMAYRQFSLIKEYYEDKSNAVRMQKSLYPNKIRPQLNAPWYPQSTDFTCGPASLMMAMSALSPTKFNCEQMLEIDIWRQANTVFMLSGIAGTHPFGLAAYAAEKGFSAEVIINTDEALFTKSVRSEKKKQLIEKVHQDFCEKAHRANVNIDYRKPELDDIHAALAQGKAVIVLISTYQLSRVKGPHWVLVTGSSDNCIFVHDPDFDSEEQIASDCQHLPITNAHFQQMSKYGEKGLRACVIVEKA